jgi:hypothetical protein
MLTLRVIYTTVAVVGFIVGWFFPDLMDWLMLHVISDSRNARNRAQNTR